MPLFLLVLVFGSVLSAISLQVGAATLAAGEYAFSISHQQRERSYLLHVPPHVADGGGLPLVINFHSDGSNAQAQRDYTNMSRIADAEGFAVVYPRGTGRFNSRSLTWNAGRCCGYAQDKHIDDIGFIRAVVDDVAARLEIDSGRIYATGFGNGAMMAYRLAVDAGDLLAAVAPVAGAMMTVDFTPTRQVPILHIHSIDDPLARYEGGAGARASFFTRRIDHASVERSLKHWAILNQCAELAKPVRERFGALGTAMEKHSATLFVYPRCAKGNEVAIWQLRGTGHIWPAGQQDVQAGQQGEASAIVDATVEAWRFFQRFQSGEQP